MVAINTAEIVHRMAFTRGLNWVQELSMVLAMALYFMVYALIAKNRGRCRNSGSSRRPRRPGMNAESGRRGKL